MITEDYTSYEVAKLLKEKGFPMGEHLFMYVNKDNVFMTDDYACLKLPQEEYKNFDEIYIPTITHQMAMKWLREIHKISIDICTVQGKRVSYMFNIWDFANIYDNKYIGGIFDLREQLYDFNTFEEAVEAALKYSLENLI